MFLDHRSHFGDCYITIRSCHLPCLLYMMSYFSQTEFVSFLTRPNICGNQIAFIFSICKEISQPACVTSKWKFVFPEALPSCFSGTHGILACRHFLASFSNFPAFRPTGSPTGDILCQKPAKTTYQCYLCHLGTFREEVSLSGY